MIAWLAHLYTAAGAVLAFLAARAVIDHDYRAAFLWLGGQILIDASDGIVARALRVAERTPHFDGGKLDDIVDYLAYVFVPALLVWRAVLVPDSWTLWVVGAMLLSSAYGFNRADAKTEDHFFTGFPSYWNIVVFYLLVARLPATVNALILLVLAVLVFVPVRYLYPSRTSVLMWPTNVLGAIWGLLMFVMVFQYPRVWRGLLLASLVFPIYYVVASLILQFRRPSLPPRHA